MKQNIKFAAALAFSGVALLTTPNAVQPVEAAGELVPWLVPALNRLSDSIQHAMKKEAEEHPEAYNGTLRDSPLYRDTAHPEDAKNTKKFFSRMISYGKVGANKVGGIFSSKNMTEAENKLATTKAPKTTDAEVEEVIRVRDVILNTTTLRNPALCVAARDAMKSCDLFKRTDTAVLAFQTQMGCARGAVSAAMNYTVEKTVLSNIGNCTAMTAYLQSVEAELTAVTDSVTAEADEKALQVAGVQSTRLQKRGVGKAIVYTIFALAVWKFVIATNPIFSILLFLGFLYAMNL